MMILNYDHAIMISTKFLIVLYYKKSMLVIIDKLFPKIGTLYPTKLLSIVDLSGSLAVIYYTAKHVLFIIKYHVRFTRLI